jgi:WD40 repeat protein
LAFDPRGDHLVTGGADGLTVWTSPSFERVRTLSGAGQVNDVAFSDDGTRLASVSDRGTITVWDTGTWREVLILPTTDQLNGVAFSSDGTTLATVSASGELRTYALDLARLLEIAGQRLRAPSAGSSVIAGEPTPLDGAYQVTITESDGLAAGVDPETAGNSQAGYTLTLLEGSYRLTQDSPFGVWVETGTFDVAGDRIVLTNVTHAWCAGTTYEATWDRDGASLTFERVVVTDSETCPDDGWASLVFASEPWTRIGKFSATG